MGAEDADERSGGLDVEESLAAAGWPRVMDELLRGLCHDLNGRVSSLEGLLMLLGLDERDTPVVPFLESEAGRLTEVVRVLRTLTGDPTEPPEPLLLADVLDWVGRLHPKHRGLESVSLDVVIAEGMPPLRAHPVRLGRTLLVLLSRAGKEALDLGARRIRAEAAADGGDVIVDVGPWQDGWIDWEPGTLDALGRVAGVDGGAVTRADEVVRLRFPAMTRPGG